LEGVEGELEGAGLIFRAEVVFGEFDLVLEGGEGGGGGPVLVDSLDEDGAVD